MPESLRILGIDPGSRVLGYAVVESCGRELRYIECGVLMAPARNRPESRLAEIARGLSEIMAELKPDAVAAEEIFVALNVRSAISLGQARGVVLAVAGMAGLPVFGYPPALVKQAVTGRGRASKAQVALMVRALCGLKKIPRPDAADALAVAVAHANIRRGVPMREFAAVEPAKGRPVGSPTESGGSLDGLRPSRGPQVPPKDVRG